jgi:cysteinyl-tRNA synthetase
MRYSLFLPILILLAACNKKDDDNPVNPAATSQYRQDMRSFVIGISHYAKTVHPGFAVIPQNGIDLMTENAEPDGPLSTNYLAAIDGMGQEDLFYGYNNDDEATPSAEREFLQPFLTRASALGKRILVTDYCSASSRVAQSYQKNAALGFISFAANQRGLNNIPAGTPMNVNADTIHSLAQAKNFLYLINPESFATHQQFVDAVTATNYDVLIMDVFAQDGTPYTPAEVAQLHQKANGGQRLVIAYMSIGEAEDYRYYWQASWAATPPSWLSAENPDWPGNYKVKYWDAAWQSIIYGNSNAYLDRILSAGFDGTYLDIIDGFEYWEGE